MRPTRFPSVPRVYEKVHARGRWRSSTRRPGAKRRLIDWALDVGRRASRAAPARRARCRRCSPLQHRLADRLVYSKVKARLGGRLRFAISGGAPLSREIAEFFHALDILILEGYGLTECTTASHGQPPGRATASAPSARRCPGVEVRIADDGEILIRGPTRLRRLLQGRRRRRAEALDDDGWLHTGDVGEIDDDGFLRITDRKKDIIVTAGGKNVAPQNLENELKASKYVSQVVASATAARTSRRCSRSIRPRSATWAAARGLRAATPPTTRRARRCARSSRARRRESTRAARRYEQIKRFVVLPRDFSQEEGEVTPTLKLKRRADPGALRPGHRGALRERRATPDRRLPVERHRSGPNSARSARNRTIGFVPRP